MSIFRIFGKKAELAWQLWRMKPHFQEFIRRLKDMERLKSRKFWVLVASSLLVGVNEALGRPIPEDAFENIIKVVMTYLVGQSVADIGNNIINRVKKTKKTKG